MDEKLAGRLRLVIALIVSIGVCLAVGVFAARITAPAVQEWYPSIKKPFWTPPGEVFGPVWSTLYFLMGVSAWLVWKDSAGAMRREALTFFAIQLALNGAWSYVFFSLQSPGWAALEMSLLWVMILATIRTFAPINQIAATLLVPYLLWVSFALVLNLAIWIMNH